MNKLNFIILFVIIVFTSCLGGSNSNKLDSDDYNTKEERVKILKKEIHSFSNFEDAEFELFNVNGFSNSRTAVPGASSWDYKFVIRINPLDIDKWTDGMIKIENKDYDNKLMENIIQVRKDNWRIYTKPEFYVRNDDNVLMVVYRKEGIIYKRVVNL